LIRLYVIGFAILLIAILANTIIVKLKVKSWYDFIGLLTLNNSSAFKMLSIIDYIWLFIGYPLALGIGYWIGDKIYHLTFT